MDKENLYYIVRKGTNDRMTGMNKSVLMIGPNITDSQIEFYGLNFEKISVADYEERFVDKETE